MRCLGILASLIFVSVVLAGGSTPLTPAEAAKQAKKDQVTVEMTVQSVGIAKQGEHWWLNSEADYKDSKNLTVFIPRSTVERLKKNNITDPATYKGKTIQVTGVVELRGTRPEIILHRTEQIKIVK